ncbi:MAG: KilA-N domain-containing protein [Muribaculaceae bacterium]|nr:KilA-N domain-containing protein [Muribaculaceae bacterium]
MTKITVKDTEVNVVKVNGEDYICLTDMIRAKDGDFFITDWLRNRNTLEFIGIWEKVYNPNFNYGEFATIRIPYSSSRNFHNPKDLSNSTKSPFIR